MIPAKHRELPDGSRRGAFTLVEIVVSLTVIAVIAAVAIPTMKGLTRDEKIREPMAALAAMVQETRHRALREGKSYQIVFEPGGIHATPSMYPYEKLEDYLKHLEEMRRPPAQEVVQEAAFEMPETAGAAPAETPWTMTIPLDENTRSSVLLWGDGEWDQIERGELRRWEFQASGMASPARVRLRLSGMEMEAGFDALTGEHTGEKFRRISP